MSGTRSIAACEAVDAEGEDQFSNECFSRVAQCSKNVSYAQGLTSLCLLGAIEGRTLRASAESRCNDDRLRLLWISRSTRLIETDVNLPVNANR